MALERCKIDSISLESFRGPLFRKTSNWSGNHCSVSYSKPALRLNFCLSDGLSVHKALHFKRICISTTVFLYNSKACKRLLKKITKMQTKSNYHTQLKNCYRGPQASCLLFWFSIPSKWKVVYKAHLMKHSILWIPNFNFPKPRCWKEVHSF